MTDISTGRQRGIVPFVDETTGRLPDQYIPQGVIDLQGNLEQAVTNASASATAASQSASQAQSSATAADSSAKAASTSSESAKTASNSATASKDAAAQSASQALASAQAAETSKTNAEASAQAAETSKTNAASSASAAKISETNAAASATAAQNAVDGFGLEVGTTTTGNSGTDAVVEIQKTGTKYTANFTIPRGDKGEQGLQGPEGPQGPKGEQGPMGDVTHAAIEAVGEARRYAALAQANGWAMGGDASLAMRRLDLLDTLAGINGAAARHVNGPASEPSGEVSLINNQQITGISLNIRNSFQTRAMLSRAWRLMVQIRAPRGCRLSACWLSSDEVPDPGMLSWVSVAAGSEPHRQWVPLPAFDPSATQLVVLARPAGEEAGTLDGVSFGLSDKLAEWESAGWYYVSLSPAWDSWTNTKQHVYMALDLAPAADSNAIRGDAASLETALTSAGSLVYEADWLTGAPSTSPSPATNISSVSIPLLADGAAGANLVRVDLDALTDTSLAVAWDDPDSRDTVDGLLARARVVPVKAGLDQTIDIRIPTMPDSGNPKRRLRIFLPSYRSAGQVRFHVWAEPPAEATVFDLDSTPGFAAAHNGTILDAADGRWTEYIPAIRLGRVTGLAMRRTSSASPLSSASMLFLGDSWCAGSGDGTGGWATLIKATYPDATVINKGHYGADWSQAAGYHCPFDGSEPSDPLPDATDYLVVQAYTNGLYQASSEQNGVVTDGKSGLPLGTPSTDHWKGIDGLNASYPQDSHCRRADWVLGSLARKYAGKGTRLLLIAPYRAPSQDGENNAYRLLLPSIFAIARKWGYRILDNFTSSPIPYWDRTLAEPYMWHRTANDNGGEEVDDTHLGLAGNKRVTPAIVTALEQL